MTASSEQLDESTLRLIAAIADVERLAILGNLAIRELTTEQLASETTLDPMTVSNHLAILGRSGLISTRKDGHRRLLALRPDRLTELAAWSDNALSSVAVEDDLAEVVAEGVRQFFSGRRLTSFPAQQARKVEVLSVLIRDFEPGAEYAETEVNQILGARHPDFATLRRALIDEGLMTRRSGIYRRED